MKIAYFPDTDTLYIELRSTDVVDTRDLDARTVADLDDRGEVVALTFEQARSRADLAHLAVDMPSAA